MTADRRSSAATTHRARPGLGGLLDWLVANLARPLTVDDMARRAGTSARTLNRRFRAEVGTTPLQWLLDARVRRSRWLPETSDLGVGAIAAATGFEDPVNLRQRFRERLGVSPTACRRTFAGVAATLAWGRTSPPRPTSRRGGS